MKYAAILALTLAAVGAARAHVPAAQARVELTSYEAVYSSLLKQGLRVQYELTRATNFASASGEVTNVEWFAKDSFNAKLHGGREYLAFSNLEPTFLGLNKTWPFHVADDCTFATKFFEVRLFKSPGNTSAEVFYLLRDDTNGKLLKQDTLPLTIGGDVRFFAVAPPAARNAESNAPAAVAGYADLKARVQRGVVPTLTPVADFRGNTFFFGRSSALALHARMPGFSCFCLECSAVFLDRFRYVDGVNGDDHAGAFVASPVARIVDENTADERIEVYLDVVTFYGPATKVQDWGRLTYFKHGQSAPAAKTGAPFAFDVLVQTRVEILLGVSPITGRPAVGTVLENNAFFLRWGETAWVWDHYSN